MARRLDWNKLKGLGSHNPMLYVFCGRRRVFHGQCTHCSYGMLMEWNSDMAFGLDVHFVGIGAWNVG